MDDTFSATLQQFQSAKLARYLRLLESSRSRSSSSSSENAESSPQFWDCVVLTACDPSQARSYEIQLKKKLERREIPREARYLVIADPEGPKVGNGGSTLHVLKELRQHFDEEQLAKMKLLIIHAGGYSKRLPHVSALGKIFTALPLGDTVLQMLELKFAMLVDFPSKMLPGVFVTCADDIELFDSADDGCALNRPGFTALAHPSSIAIGETHGVFVLSDSAGILSKDFELEEQDRRVLPASCLKFLHKPKAAKMAAEGAVFHSKKGSFVYTDSAYYFDYAASNKLLHIYASISPVSCEIDAYGDILQALGPNASADYTQNTENVSKVEGNLVAIRAQIFEFLKGTPLNVLVFNSSKFYHIGTIEEFLTHYSGGSVFMKEMGGNNALLTVAEDPKEEPRFPQATTLSTLFADPPSTTVGPGAILEYCRVGRGSVIGENSILSNVDLPPNTNLPKNTLLHTMSIKRAGKPLFVTISFSAQDDLKKGHKAGESVLMGRCKVVEAHPSGGSLWEAGASSLSLWDAKLFPCCETREESVGYAVSMAQAVAESRPFTATKSPHGWASMADALILKDPQEMLRQRTGLETDILVASLCRTGPTDDIASIPLVKELVHELDSSRPENLGETLLAQVARRCAEKGHRHAHNKLWNYVLERASQGLESARKRRWGADEEGLLRRLISYSEEQVGGGK